MNTALNYQPEVLVDTADLSREDWLDYRRLGRFCVFAISFRLDSFTFLA